MRKGSFVPMILLLCLLTACGGKREQEGATELRLLYQEMRGCTMTAAVSCTQYETLWEAVLRCTYVPDGESVVEVLSPESIAGVTVTLDGETRFLRAGGKRLNAGSVSREEISPAACLPRLMEALRDGWLLEENPEEWDGVPCLRLTADQTGKEGGKIFSTLWLRQEDGTPLRGEISVEGELVLSAEFTDFSFSDIMAERGEDGT